MNNRRFYDRQCQPISISEWMVLFDNKDYSVLEQFEADAYGVPVQISTVWIGLPQPLGIFESAIRTPDMNKIYRWSTEQEAREAHKVLVRAYEEGRDPDVAIALWRTGE